MPKLLDTSAPRILALNWEEEELVILPGLLSQLPEKQIEQIHSVPGWIAEGQEQSVGKQISAAHLPLSAMFLTQCQVNAGTGR